MYQGPRDLSRDLSDLSSKSYVNFVAHRTLTCVFKDVSEIKRWLRDQEIAQGSRGQRSRRERSRRERSRRVQYQRYIRSVYWKSCANFVAHRIFPILFKDLLKKETSGWCDSFVAHRTFHLLFKDFLTIEGVQVSSHVALFKCFLKTF
jgi:hypothetical protein